jgi:ClpP class serine protease
MSEWFTLSFGGILTTGIAIVGLGFVVMGSLYVLKKVYNLKGTYKENKNTGNNIIPIVHSTDWFSVAKNSTSITVNTHMDFIKAYDKMDKNKDIHIIIHSVGGLLTSTEAMCNCILNHKQNNSYKGDIIIYVPYYAYSGACMIAITCDKIVMRTNAILGPCDAQSYVKGTHASVASIIDAVKYKKELKEKIDEPWLAGAFDAEQCKKRQSKFVDKLVEYKVFTEETGKNIYEEFFSGKYNHDKIFSAQDSLKLGLNIEIVENMPRVINDVIIDLID